MIPTLRVPKWVKKHLFEYSSIEEIPPEDISRIKKNLENIQSDKPLITIGVIAYNEEKTILSCLSSLSEQKCKYPIEIIVSNNNSKDNTQEILDMCGVRSILEKRQGPGFAREAIMTRAKGKFILNADADIIFPPTWAEEFVNNLDKPNVAAVFSVDSYIPDHSKGRLGLSLFELLRDISLSLKCINRPELAVGGGSFGFLAKYGKEIGWKTDIKRGEDGSMAFSLKKFGRIKFLNNSKVRIWTTVRSLDQGNLFSIILSRLKKEFSRIDEYITRQKGGYKDREENFLPPQR